MSHSRYFVSPLRDLSQSVRLNTVASNLRHADSVSGDPPRLQGAHRCLKV